MSLVAQWSPNLTNGLVRVVLGFPVSHWLAFVMVGSPNIGVGFFVASWASTFVSCLLFSLGRNSPAWTPPFALVWPPFALLLDCLPCCWARGFVVRPLTLALGCSCRLGPAVSLLAWSCCHRAGGVVVWPFGWSFGPLGGRLGHSHRPLAVRVVPWLFASSLGRSSLPLVVWDILWSFGTFFGRLGHPLVVRIVLWSFKSSFGPPYRHWTVRVVVGPSVLSFGGCAGHVVEPGLVASTSSSCRL